MSMRRAKRLNIGTPMVLAVEQAALRPVRRGGSPYRDRRVVVLSPWQRLGLRVVMWLVNWLGLPLVLADLNDAEAQGTPEGPVDAPPATVRY